MVSKTQANAKEKPMNRCKECVRDFQTLAALKSHMMAKHPEKYKLMQNNEIVSKDEKKTALVPPTSRVSRRLQQKKSTDTEEIIAPSKTSNTRIKGGLKTVFECPKCLQEFPVYFSAMKHIQKRHCVDMDGNPVSPNSSDLIKPRAKETAIASENTNNKNSASQDNGTYSCLACKHTFHNLASFDEHIEGNHNDKVNIFVLENMNDFLIWKTNLEAKLKVKYLTLSNTAQKQYYQCNYVSPKNSANMTHLCPSVIIVREFAKGVHVHYHTEHHEHNCESTHHNITSSNNETFDNVIMSGDDIYTNYKNLMNSIVKRAHVLKSTQLKQLYISALEMQAYLNSVIDKDTMLKTDKMSNNKADNVSIASDDNNQADENLNDSVNKTMNDDQISKALEAPRVSARLKRKSDSLPAPEVKKKKVDKEPKDTQKAGLKENNSQTTDLLCSERFESPRPSIASPVTQSPSFNDSYKQFIEGSSPKIEKKDPPPAKKAKKQIVKTKIGQFSPKKVVQPKVEAESEAKVVTESKNKVVPESKAKVVTASKTKLGPENKAKVVTESKTKLGTESKSKVVTESKSKVVTESKSKVLTESKSKVVTESKAKVVTESVDRKKKKKFTPKSKTSLDNVKLEDTEYEIVEQENDCNILILKI